MKTKVITPVVCDPLMAFYRLLPEYAKSKKQEEIRKSAENWCLK